MITKELVLFASLGGFLPALLWFWFWLKEDKKNPEPKKMLIWTFIAGMISVVPAIFLELLIEPWGNLEGEDIFLASLILAPVFIIAANAAIEEIVKFVAAYFAALRTKVDDDEAIDPIIYMITAALGFAAVENTLFIINTFLDSPVGKELVSSLVVGNIRFIGASLLHIASSATIGLFLAFGFGRSKKTKFLLGLIGMVLATSLHAYFNFLIMSSDNGFLLSFLLVWIVIIFLIFFLEKIKRIRK